jgi:lysozyme family protein
MALHASGYIVANQAAAVEVNDTNMTTATFFGEASQRIESFDLALNNELIYKETASSQEVLITNRAPGGTAVIEAPAIGSTDYFADAVGVVTASTSLVLGATGGNIVTLTAAQTDITGVSYGDTNGVVSLVDALLWLCRRPLVTTNSQLAVHLIRMAFVLKKTASYKWPVTVEYLWMAASLKNKRSMRSSRR